MTDNANIVSLFLNAAKTCADKNALVQGAHSVSYHSLHTAVKDTAYAYSQKGIEKGDKVLVFVPMSTDLYTKVLALLYLGAIPVFIDEWVNMERLKACCRNIPCKALIAPGKLLWLSWFVKELRQIPIKIKAGKQYKSGSGIELAQVSAEDTALITFTTGSTGIPKAANRTHTYLHAQFEALRHLVENDANASLITLPIVTLINLALGKTTVLPGKGFAVKKPATSAILKEDILNNNVDEIITSPAILADITNHLQSENKYINAIRYITTGGGAVFPQQAATTIKCFEHAKCTVVYGSTEAEPISETDMAALAKVPAEKIIAQGLLVGKVHNSTSLAIIKVTSEPVSANNFNLLAIGETGEIVVAGNHVLKEYINNEEAIRQNKILVDGIVWHRTGDAGSIDTDGNLYLKGRCNEIIHHNNRTYYPLITTYAFEQMTGYAAALLLHNNKLLLVIESKAPIDTASLTKALAALHLTDADILYKSHLLRDARHRTKIDYENLRAEL